jgi:cytochrome b involved in lipid metabolism
VVLFIGFEFNFWLMKQREDAFPTDGYPVISEEDFNKRVLKGENLCILDNLVLDLTPYVHRHPGGAFLLTQTVGRDISKFFYGGYALDGNGGKPGSNKSVHTHTNVARKIAIKHVVAFIGSATVSTLNY